MTVPLLYSFRRCPYAMRARLALLTADVTVALREVMLRAKPAALLDASPKGTVPVLVLPEGRVIDQSLDIMRWALAESRAGHEMAPADADLVATNDGAFKHHLDRYKYADRYRSDGIDHRAEATAFLQRLDARLGGGSALGGDRLGMVDLAILPFVRQFAETDRAYFDGLPFAGLQNWLASFVASTLFERAMVRVTPWEEGQRPVLFPLRLSEAG